MAGSINGWFLGEAFYHPAINNCYVTGTISGSNFLGGFVGVANCAYIRSSSFSGVVNGGWEAGGFAGAVSNYSQVQNCYSSGTITYGYDVGGLIGEITSGTVSACFWDVITSLQVYSAGGAGVQGKTTAEMTTQSTFTSAGWDFAAVWAMNPENNNGYPYLIWGLPAEPPSMPQNVHIAYQDGLIVITWDEAPNADSYLVVSSDNPIHGFSEELGGSFTGNRWTKAEDFVYRFYRVISVAE